MSRRTVLVVSAVAASVLFCVHLATASDGNTAADHCLTAPNGEPSDGGHWYYRIERITKRHCWYVRGEKEKLAPVASQDPSPSNESVSPRKSANGPFSDAHAELAPAPSNPGVTAIQAAHAAPSLPLAGTDDTSTQNPTIASRWPQSPGTNNPVPASDDRVADDQSISNAIPPSAPTATPAGQAGHASVDTSGKPSSPIPKLLVVMFGALSVAGVFASAFIRTGGKRSARRQRPADPHSLWGPPPPQQRGTAARRPGFPKASDDDPSRRIEEMLAQLSRKATR